MIRRGLGKGKGSGYKNIIPQHDSRIHQLSGKGVKQPQRTSTLKKKASLKLVKGLRRGFKRCLECRIMFPKESPNCLKCKRLNQEKQAAKLAQPKYVITDNGVVIHTSKNEVAAFRWLQNHPAFRKKKYDEVGRFKIKKGGKCSPSQLKHGTDPDRLFSKSQLKQGVKTELEHTDDRSLAKAIAKAHLTEDKAYYTKLKRVKL